LSDSSEKKKKMDRSPERRGSRRSQSNDVGNALKSVYDRALNEAIPPDLLDLLGKLD
jgi:hypothetical protein